jgi:hypothetical protein
MREWRQQPLIEPVEEIVRPLRCVDETVLGPAIRSQRVWDKIRLVW